MTRVTVPTARPHVRRTPTTVLSPAMPRMKIGFIVLFALLLMVSWHVHYVVPYVAVFSEFQRISEEEIIGVGVDLGPPICVGSSALLSVVSKMLSGEQNGHRQSC